MVSFFIKDFSLGDIYSNTSRDAHQSAKDSLESGQNFGIISLQETGSKNHSHQDSKGGGGERKRGSWNCSIRFIIAALGIVSTLDGVLVGDDDELSTGGILALISREDGSVGAENDIGTL